MTAAPTTLLALDPGLAVPLGIGVAVAAVVLIGLLVLALRGQGGPMRRSRLRKLERSVNSPEDAHQSFSDRRNSIRREGPAVKISATSPALRGRPETGFVLDRSTGGLRVALSVAVPSGSSLKVRAQNAPDTVPWVTVIVRSCRNTGGHFELGCEFDQTPPWNVLLLFG